MNDIDFVQRNNKRKKAFMADNFARIVLSEIFPVLKGFSYDDIHIIHYVCFRGKRLFDVIVRYKNICIPMALDFSIESDLEGTYIKGYRATYKFNISLKEGCFESIMFNTDIIDDFDVNTFKEFLGADAERFSLLHDNYYSEINSPMTMRQQVVKTCKWGESTTTEIAFDAEFHYMSADTGFFFNLYSNDIEHDRFNKKAKEEVIFYNLKPMEGTIAGSFTDIDFWALIKEDASMIAEPFRLAIQKHYNVDDHVVPRFNSHVELFDYYNEHRQDILAISEMVKI